MKGYPVPLEAVLIAEVRVGDVELETFGTLKGRGWFIASSALALLCGRRVSYRRHLFLEQQSTIISLVLSVR